MGGGFGELFIRLWRHIRFAALNAYNILISPIPILKFFIRDTDSSRGRVRVKLSYEKAGLINKLMHEINYYFFSEFPQHYPLHKKLALLKSRSPWGKAWDIILLILSLIACAIYVSETYIATYRAVQTYKFIELFFTEFFAVDLIYNFFAASNKLTYMVSSWTLVDILTVLPVYLTYALGSSVNLAVFRVIRILRLIRIMRMFKLLNGLDGVRRQIIQLSLTLICLVFVAAGIFQLFYNDVEQYMAFQCNYIGEDTHWIPSCSPDAPIWEMDSCDCEDYNCKSFYNRLDVFHNPTGVRCQLITFFDAVYFMIVTVSTVGYGDVSPNSTPCRALVIFFILTSLVVIPMQVNALATLLSINSVYRQPYVPGFGEEHIIVCGHVHDLEKLERFLKEMYHPDKGLLGERDIRVLILSPVEPAPEMRRLITSGPFDERVSYLMGSALAISDLQKARADVASAAVFLCNAIDGGEEGAKLDDAANVLRTLSVTNFNPNIECLVQVMRPEDRDILRECDIDVVLCLDEFRTTMQARNAVCFGMTAFIENLFSTCSLPDNVDFGGRKWMDEYIKGASFEPYFIPIPFSYMTILSFDWPLIAEGIFLGYDVIAIGLCNSATNEIVINPSKLELQEHKFKSRFFKEFDQVIVLSASEVTAQMLSRGLEDDAVVNNILDRLVVAEEFFHVRKPFVPKEATVTAKMADHPEDHLKGSNTHRSKPSFSARVDASTKPAGGSIRIGVAPPEEDSKQLDLDIEAQLYSVPKPQPQPLPDTELFVKQPPYSDSDLFLEGPRYDLPLEASTLAPPGHPQLMNAHLSSVVGPHPHDTTDNGGDLSYKDLLRYAQHRENVTDDWNPVDEKNMTSGFSIWNNLVEEDGEPVLRRGEKSKKVVDARNIDNHIVVLGSMNNIECFVAELRRPLVANYEYHPIVLLSDTVPEAWLTIEENYDDIYMLICRSTQLELAHFEAAFAVVLLASRDSVQEVEEENLDAETLFMYLKLEPLIPRTTFFTIELTCNSNMPVLNSTMLKRAKQNFFKDSASRMKSVAGKRKVKSLKAVVKSMNIMRSLAKKPNTAAAAAVGAVMPVDEIPVSDSKPRRGGVVGGVEEGGGDKKNMSDDEEDEEDDGDDDDPGSLGSVGGITVQSLTRHNTTASATRPPSQLNAVDVAQLSRQLRTLATTVRKLETNPVYTPATKQVKGAEMIRSMAEIEQLLMSRHNTGDSASGIGGQKIHGKGTVASSNLEDSFQSTIGITRKEAYWTLLDKSNALPVFAGGRAYVPLVFDMLLTNSFFGTTIPLLCERLICGQKYQCMMQIEIPAAFVGRCYVDIYRAFQSRGLLVMALYRTPFLTDKAVIPYVFMAPDASSILRGKDRIFVYGNPIEMRIELERGLSKPFVQTGTDRCGIPDHLFDLRSPAAVTRIRGSHYEGVVSDDKVGLAAAAASESDEEAAGERDEDGYGELKSPPPLATRLSTSFSRV